MDEVGRIVGRPERVLVGFPRFKLVTSEQPVMRPELRGSRKSPLVVLNECIGENA
jgi:hypothetical protein